MENLKFCRICLTENAEHVISSLELQHTYEKLSSVPFQKDKRPTSLCYICFAQLKASHRLRVQCLRAEQLLNDMFDHFVSADEMHQKATIVPRSSLKRLSMTDVEHYSVGEASGGTVGVKEEVFEVPIVYENEIKIERLSDEDITNDTLNGAETESNQEQDTSDSYDDIPLNKIRTNLSSQDNVSTQKPPAKFIMPYICNICDKGFTATQYLNTHMKVHTGIDAFSCDVCNKRFSTKSHLNTHKREHSGEKPFSCEICHKRFTENSRLTKHMQVHTGGKPFSCNVCTKSFSKNLHLVRHMCVHTGEKPFSCDLCDKKFTVSSNLIKHKRVHTGEKPFACDVCDKRFTEKSNLTTHMLIHTGEMPFSCNICDKNFRYKNVLSLHMRIHTG